MLDLLPCVLFLLCTKFLEFFFLILRNRNQVHQWSNYVLDSLDNQRVDPYKLHINRVHHLQKHLHIYKQQLLQFIHNLRDHCNQYYHLTKRIFLLYYILLSMDLLCDLFHKNHNQFLYGGIYIYKLLHLHRKLMSLLDHISNLMYKQLSLLWFILNQNQQDLDHLHHLIVIYDTIL